MQRWKYTAIVCLSLGMLSGCKEDRALTTASQALRTRDLDTFKSSLEMAKDVNVPIGQLKRTIAHQLVLSEAANDRAYFDQVVGIFVNKGGDLNGRDIYGRTPLHYAVRTQRGSEIYTTLIRHGSDPCIKDKAGLIPYDYTNSVSGHTSSPQAPPEMKQDGIQAQVH